ncbi:peptidoglycan DD-metalloendopeptidase family protein [Novosphingobium sp. ERN07]|uniref:peptidoglycan DD-metalloendopeptidase family protein n=1 Tax=Novosphingobium sp. ERN07 TaxID=2726187 RepID=UPI00351B14E1
MQFGGDKAMGRNVFTPRDQMLAFAGAGGGSGFGLRTTPPIASESAPESNAVLNSTKMHLGALRRNLVTPIERWCAAKDLAPDLAEDIGSARWFRSFGTMLGLGTAAVLMWPSFAPLQAAPLTALDESAVDEFRVQGIRPLSLGADNGRQMTATAAVIPLAAAPERPSIDLTATLGAGDTFPRMLQRAGLANSDIVQVLDMVGGQIKPGTIPPGTRFAIRLGARTSPAQPRPLEQLSFRPRFDLALDIKRSGGGLALATNAIAVDSAPMRIRGIVGGSLYRSARAAGAPPSAVQDYLRTIDEHMAFEEIAPGDEFDLVFANRRAASGEQQAGDLVYAGVVRSGKPVLQLLRWGKDREFYSPQSMAEGSQETTGFLGSPVNGRITSNFGARRHPILGYVRMHAGVDFGAPWGAPIYAATDGRVSIAGWHGGHGNYVRLDHGGGIGTGYGHMSRIAVSAGMSVRRGQVIGYVGSTGLSTGPHLHYEMYRNGQTVNPLSMTSITQRATVDPAQLAAFKAKLAQVTAIKANTLR